MSKQSIPYLEEEKYKDLNRAFKNAAMESNYGSQEEIISAAVNMPSRRFWVTPERLRIVISAFLNGNDPVVYIKNPLKREMFLELYNRYKAAKENDDYKGLPLRDICDVLVMQQAPKFYMEASYALKVFYKGRGGCR